MQVDGRALIAVNDPLRADKEPACCMLHAAATARLKNVARSKVCRHV